jgi:long-chain fatty acid transport protein
MPMRIKRLSLYVVVLWGGVLSAQVYGAGFALTDQSASSAGNAYAGGAARAEDASTVYFNPAGMTNLKAGAQLLAGGHVIEPTLKFTNDGSVLADTYSGQPLTGDGTQDGGVPALVPNFYYVQGITPDLTAGLGINVPFGLAVKYDDNWVGRYNAVDSELTAVNFNPSLAYKVMDNLSLGLGVSVQTVEVKLSSAIDFGALILQPQQHDGFVSIKGDNNDNLSYGWNAGLLYQLDRTRVGLAYRSAIDHKIKGDADFTVPGSVSSVTSTGLFTDSKVSTDVTFPQTLSLSAFHRYNDALAVMADITWTGWSDFNELRIKYDNPEQPDSVTTEDWKDTYRYSVGADYRLYPQWLLRTGIAYDQTPVPNAQRRTARIPDNNRLWWSLGLGYQVGESLSLDFAYSHLWVNNTEIHNQLETSVPALNATLNGSYEANVNIFSAQLVWNIQ